MFNNRKFGLALGVLVISMIIILAIVWIFREYAVVSPSTCIPAEEAKELDELPKFVMVTQPISRGSIISAEEVVLTETAEDPLTGAITDLTKVVGKKAKVIMLPGQFIHPRMLEE